MRFKSFPITDPNSGGVRQQFKRTTQSRTGGKEGATELDARGGVLLFIGSSMSGSSSEGRVKEAAVLPLGGHRGKISSNVKSPVVAAERNQEEREVRGDAESSAGQGTYMGKVGNLGEETRVHVRKKNHRLRARQKIKKALSGPKNFVWGQRKEAAGGGGGMPPGGGEPAYREENLSSCLHETNDKRPIGGDSRRERASEL